LSTKTADDSSLSEFKEIPIPEDTEISTFGNDAMITLRSDWSPPGYEYVGEGEGSSSVSLLPAGSLIVAPMVDVMNNDYSKSTVLFLPTSSRSLQSTTTTKDYVILDILEDVRTTLVIWKKETNDNDGNDKWTLQESPANNEAVKIGESLGFGSPNRDSSIDNRLFLWRDGYLIPDSLEYIEDVSDLSNSIKLKSKPSMFNANDLTVDQYFVSSKDGTKIPYFIIRKKDIVYDGSNPTLLDAYGGFEISMLPGYSAAVGAAWLEHGGVKVIANIRGGGEYGPKWHQSALKENRYKCYEDMEAVGQDLIDRQITSPSKLACIGGSNGTCSSSVQCSSVQCSTVYLLHVDNRVHGCRRRRRRHMFVLIRFCRRWCWRWFLCDVLFLPSFRISHIWILNIFYHLFT
jgi:prolyl oligopeptidase